MKRLTALVVVAASFGALALSAPALADAGVKRLAKVECREDKLTEPAEFSALYNGTDRAAMKRCVRAQVREARAECRQDRREEPAEFSVEYGGTDSAAIKRCMADELT